MNKIYLLIIILIITLLILNYIENNYPIKENFCNNMDNTFNTNVNNDSSINFNNNTNFKNFSTNGLFPPFQKCPICRLNFDCTNYPYEVDSNNVSVCTTCVEKNNNNNYVLGRSPGRPRICRKLNY